MRIALGQLESGTDIRANLAAIDRFAAEAARDGATLVAFPEYATYEKKKVDATFPEVAEPLDGPVCQELARTARRHRIALVAGVGRPRTSRARRTTPWWLSGPTADGWLLPEDPPLRRAGLRGVDIHQAGPVHQPGGVRARGSAVRPDDLLRPAVPGAGEVAGRRRRQVLLVCSSWVPGAHKTEQWLALNAARAIENSVYVAGVCQAPPVSVGRSVLVDPMGVVEADLGLEPRVRAVEVSLETVDRVRESFPMFRQRRL